MEVWLLKRNLTAKREEGRQKFNIIDPFKEVNIS